LIMSESEQPSQTAAAVRRALRAQADPDRARGVARFFKTGPGEYGEGDRFIGVNVPTQRAIARRFRDLPFAETDRLLQSSIHEERLTALLILVGQFRLRQADDRQRRRIFRLYMKRLRFVNNWDLVDTSAGPIVGGWLGCAAGSAERTRRNGADRLGQLARSKSVWSRRVAMIATSHFIAQRDHADAIRMATLLVDDEHDLIQKAVGWMLREVGKRCPGNQGPANDPLRQFLAKHAATMPRTALRYAIERFPAAERKKWMSM
jgi:3-methyladenine DNA glycosylase AlkD